jgi:hypothetical protein
VAQQLRVEIGQPGIEPASLTIFPPMPMFKFRMGDVFDADDPLSIWIATLSVAFNDAVHSSNKVQAADEDLWKHFYEWRVAISHFNEACRHLERGQDIVEVVRFLEAEGDLKKRFEEVLSQYEALRVVANRIRNEAAFHYPGERGKKAIARVVRMVADEDGFFGEHGKSTKIRDTRQRYADFLVAGLVIEACGAAEDAYEKTMDRFGEAMAAFGLFANAALVAYFWRHRHAIRPVTENGEPAEPAD